MALIVKADVKLYLDQVTGTTHDTLLDAICLRVEDTIKLYLGLDFAGYSAASTKVVYGSGTPWLVLPPHSVGTVTLVTYGTGTPTTVTGWTEDEAGNLYFDGSSWGWYSWQSQRYTVTAAWGFPTWPDAVKEVAVELACNVFKERDTGHFSDVVGVLGAGGDVAVGYANALTKRQRMVLDMTRRKYQQAVFV